MSITEDRKILFDKKKFGSNFPSKFQLPEAVGVVYKKRLTESILILKDEYLVKKCKIVSHKVPPNLFVCLSVCFFKAFLHLRWVTPSTRKCKYEVKKCLYNLIEFKTRIKIPVK